LFALFGFFFCREGGHLSFYAGIEAGDFSFGRFPSGIAAAVWRELAIRRSPADLPGAVVRILLNGDFSLSVILVAPFLRTESAALTSGAVMLQTSDGTII
jgi:hypothetical protein